MDDTEIDERRGELPAAEVTLMASSVTKGFALGATLFGGLLAGVTANRALVQMPAWERIGVISWANFTRVESLGLGYIFYPVLGLAALLLTIGAAIAFRFDRAAQDSRSFPIYSAVVLAIAWALVTRGVLVPAMFSVRAAGDNAAELQRIFLSVVRWSAVNDVLHVLTFGLNLWALTELW
jgi:hypothetical protein